MIRCPYCGKDLPNALPNCPSCRSPIPGGSIPSISFKGDLPLPRNVPTKQEYDVDAVSEKTVHDLDAHEAIGHQGPVRRRLFDVTDILPTFEPTGKRSGSHLATKLITKTQIGDVLIGVVAAFLFIHFWPWGMTPGAVVGTAILVALRRYREITWGAVGAVIFIMAYLVIGLAISGSLGSGD